MTVEHLLFVNRCPDGSLDVLWNEGMPNETFEDIIAAVAMAARQRGVDVESAINIGGITKPIESVPAPIVIHGGSG